jgi:polysaccharide export outer membrane protein
MVYLRNVADKELMEGVPSDAPVYKVKINDNLYVDIQSLSPEVNMLFNPSNNEGNGSNTFHNYGTVTTQYINGYQVDLNGYITLPLLGKFKLAGLTLEECKALVQKKTNEFIKDGNVKLRLLSYKLTVLGEVKHPGVYYNYNASITVLEAISMASGISDYAHVKDVLVVRPTDKGSKSYRLDLTDKKFMSSQAFYLLPNDIVYVQPDKYKSVKVNSTFYSLILSSVSTLILILSVLK